MSTLLRGTGRAYLLSAPALVLFAGALHTGRSAGKAEALAGEPRTPATV